MKPTYTHLRFPKRRFFSPGPSQRVPRNEQAIPGRAPLPSVSLMRIWEGVTDWGEVGTGYRPKEKMLKSRTDPAAMDAGRVDLQASLP